MKMIFPKNTTSQLNVASEVRPLTTTPAPGTLTVPNVREVEMKQQR